MQIPEKTTGSIVSSTSTQTQSPSHDHIKSFQLRKGHFRGGRLAAYEALWPVYGLEYSSKTLLNFEQAFARVAPTVLEIGFGMGTTTAQIANENPAINYLGVEVYNAGVGSLMKHISDQGLTNIRAIEHDAFEVLRDMIPNNSLHGVHIYFPDPWSKARHHKRRLIQPQFISLLLPKLQKGGYIHCATDWQHYAEHMLAVFNATEELANASTHESGYAERPAWRPLTKFENRGLKLGHGIWDLFYKLK